MLVSGAGLGGEKSGHVIIREHTTSGDGIVTAIELLRVMTSGVRRDRASSRRRCRSCPSSSARSGSATATSGRPTTSSGASIADAERRLAPHGRVLVRPSGTEPVLRVMVEGPDAALVAEIADAIAALAGDRLH